MRQSERARSLPGSGGKSVPRKRNSENRDRHRTHKADIVQPDSSTNESQSSSQFSPETTDSYVEELHSLIQTGRKSNSILEDQPSSLRDQKELGSLPGSPEETETANIASGTEPLSYAEATQGENARQWETAIIREEYTSIMENSTWTLTTLPPARKAIGCKWMFKIKRDHNGNITRYKARLVAKGFAQKEGLEYDFAPVTSFTSIRTILSIAAINDYEVH